VAFGGDIVVQPAPARARTRNVMTSIRRACLIPIGGVV
jgi:hypothetical protein